MKFSLYIFMIISLLIGSPLALSQNISPPPEDFDPPHAPLLSGEELQDFEAQMAIAELFSLEYNTTSTFRFPQTKWNECEDYVSGNYMRKRCSQRRHISKILKFFISNYADQCVSQGLEAFGIRGRVTDLHINHVGILGDRNHSPRSLHAENRAIDIAYFDVNLSSDREYRVTFARDANAPFYKAFRKCWGKVLHDFNECPYYGNSKELTGSIGKENRHHQNHLHLSVPFCINGRHGDYYYRR